MDTGDVIPDDTPATLPPEPAALPPAPKIAPKRNWDLKPVEMPDVLTRNQMMGLDEYEKYVESQKGNPQALANRMFEDEPLFPDFYSVPVFDVDDSPKVFQEAASGSQDAAKYVEG
eukprot:4714696-Karenia_brevis.AAC.1